MRAEAASPHRRSPTRAQVEQLSPLSIGQSRTRVYLAAPVTEFGTTAHRRALRVVRDRFPDSEVLDSAQLFADSADWRQRWPEIVHTLNRVIFVSGDDGIIGEGVVQEIVDARLRHVRCDFLTSDGEFVPIREITFQMIPAGSRVRFARIRNQSI